MVTTGELKLPRGTISWKDLGDTHAEVRFEEQDGIAILHMFRGPGDKPVFVMEYYTQESGFAQYDTREKLLEWLRYMGKDIFEYDLLGDETFQKTVLKAIDFCFASETLWAERKYDEYTEQHQYFTGKPTVNLDALPEHLRRLVKE